MTSIHVNPKDPANTINASQNALQILQMHNKRVLQTLQMHHKRVLQTLQSHHKRVLQTLQIHNKRPRKRYKCTKDTANTKNAGNNHADNKFMNIFFNENFRQNYYWALCHLCKKTSQHIDGFTLNFSMSSALAMEILQSCTKPSM